ncbi:MAG: hypothetical protein BIFFINMI_03327 [Phycisphaerae bacterium]|nr:hypothetical protein [Phycisphaerae bacterium]
MADLVSEPIEALPGTFDASAMARGEPGLPSGFRWREQEHRIVEVMRAWKKSQREGGVGELYLRRHYYQLRMSDGAVWEIYFTRQAPPGRGRRSRRQRWFLYTRDGPADS